MTKDEHSEETDLSQTNGDEQSADTQDQDTGAQDQQQGDQQQQETKQDDSGEDYRGKLNATNRFLQKEGYEFKDGGWHKKAAPAQQRSEAQQEQNSASANSLTRDEAIVIAKGYSEEELEQAKKVATLEGIKVTEAVNSDLFIGWKDKRDKEETARKAQLGTSRGSRASVKKTFSTKGLSDEDHRQMFQEKLGA